MENTRDHLSMLCDIGDLASLLAGSEDIEGFLQGAAAMISRHMASDVCSIYLYDAKAGELTLKATVGLAPDAVGKVRMLPGEGLVGATFQENLPILEACASKNPRFKYFEEANEDRFESFLAVPIRRGVQKIGVLVVQQELRDHFNDADRRALQATAAQLAGAIENARLLMNLHRAGNEGAAPDAFRFLKGESASGGFAFAGATVFRRMHAAILEDAGAPEGVYSLDDFRRAVRDASAQLMALQKGLSERLPEGASLIFMAHFMILKDPRFIGRIEALIREGAPPPEAVKTVARHYMDVFRSSPHPSIREKATDIEDLAARILKNLLRSSRADAGKTMDCIVVAGDLYPSEILKFATEEVKGIILMSGGVTSHTAILARSMKIPMVIVADHPELLNIPEGVPILLDADIGNVYIRPTDKIIRKFEARAVAGEQSALAGDSISPVTRTADGRRIRLMANINLLSELAVARDLKAEGVGLYRTEFPFLIRPTFPSEEEQVLIYKRLYDEMPDRDITIRTLDLGGDKVATYADLSGCRNPELGLRSIRFSFFNRDLFEQQIRAILRAAAGAEAARIMFPMISSLDEFREARQTVFDCIRALEKEGLPCHAAPAVGMMAELPSVLEIFDALAAEADFFAVGANDFVQYMLAVDRSDEKVGAYYLPFHPSVLRSLARIADIARRRGKEVSVCGEMAHDRTLIPFLVGVGVRSFSVDPQFLGEIQKTISGLDSAAVERFAQRLLAEDTVAGVKAALQRAPF